MNNIIANVSVVIPTFNRAELLKRAVYSVINQVEYSPLEIIVLDDYSTDNTVEILEHLRKESHVPIVFVPSHENVGPSRLRNKGIDLAKGDYVAFLDSDDLWLENKLCTFMNDLKTDNEIVIWSHHFSANENEKKLSSEVKVIPFWKQLLKNHASCSCTIIKKSNIQKFSEDMKFNEDHELFTRISFSNSIYVNQSVLTILNRGINEDGGLSGNIWKMRIGEMRTYFKVFSYFPMVIFFLPALIIFSMIKHVRLVLRRL